MLQGPQSFCLSQFSDKYNIDEIQEVVDYINYMLKDNPNAWNYVVEGGLLNVPFATSPILKIITELARNRLSYYGE